MADEAAVIDQAAEASEQQHQAHEGTANNGATVEGAESAGDGQDGQDSEQRVRGGFQRRIDKLTREKSDAAREVEFWRNRALAVDGNEGASKQQEEPKQDDGRPNPGDFDDYAKYTEALTDWKVDQKLKAQTDSQKKTEAEQEQTRRVTEYKSRETSFREATPDYDETLVDSEVPLSRAMVEELQTHEHGPALAYFLAKNAAIAEKLVDLSPVALAREIGRLESRFVPQGAAGNVRPSSAPKPPTPIGGRGSRTAEKDPGEMEPAEYSKWREKNYPQLDR